MKTYILKDLNDDTKFKVEQRSSSTGTICEMPKELIGKAFKLIDLEDELGSISTVAVLDEEAEALRLQALAQAELEKQANAYKAKRMAEYPSIGDQLDAIYKKLHLNDSTDFDLVAQKINETKLKYPKPIKINKTEGGING